MSLPRSNTSDPQARTKKQSDSDTVLHTTQRIAKLLSATMAKFDKGALVRWDALMRDQQAKLEQVSGDLTGTTAEGSSVKQMH